MSSDTGVSNPGWTIDTLLIYINKIMDERHERYVEQFKQIKEDLADLNNFVRELLPRQEYDRSLGGLSHRLDDAIRTVNVSVDALEQRILKTEAVMN